jgi:hypothetical protein
MQKSRSLMRSASFKLLLLFITGCYRLLLRMCTGSVTVRTIFRSAQEQLEIPLSITVRALFMVSSHGELPFLFYALEIFA